MLTMYYNKKNAVDNKRLLFAQILIKDCKNNIVFAVIHGGKNNLKEFMSQKSCKVFLDPYTMGDLKIQNIELIGKGSSYEDAEYIIVADPIKSSLFSFISDKEDSNNISQEISDLIKSQIKNEIPYPILDIVPEMEERIVKFIYNYAKNISSDYEHYLAKSSGFSGFLDFSFINKPEFEVELKNFIMENHGEIEFIKKFKRAPQLKVAKLMVDVNKFNLKQFQELLKRFGGKEEFEKLDFNIQKNVIYGYEFFGIEIYNLFKKLGGDVFLSLPLKNLAVTQKIKGNFRGNKKVLNALLDKFSDEFVMINSILGSLYNDTFLDLFRTIDDKKLNDTEYLKDIQINLIRILSVSNYEIKPGGEAMALACSRLMLSNETFLLYQEEYIKNIKNTKRAKQYPTLSGSVNNQYSWEVIDMSNVNAWLVGLETNCCQHLESVGGACVLYAAKHPELSGIMRVMKKGKTVAQSFFWFNQDTGDFVFDNIEVLGGELRPAIQEAYFKYIEELEKRPMFGVKRVCFGTGYSDVESWGFDGVENPTHLYSLSDGEGVYSDASTQKLLKTIGE